MKNSSINCDIVTLQDSSTNFNFSTCVSLLEVGNHFLYRISEEHLAVLKQIVSTADTIIWSTSTISLGYGPELLDSMAIGLFRTLRAENPRTKFVTIRTLDIPDITTFHQHICLVTRNTMQSSILEYEPEYMVKGGTLHINRLVEGEYLNEFVAQRTVNQRAELGKFREDSNRRLKLTITQPGMLDTFRFVDETSPALQADEIEVGVQAVGLNFRDILIALGQEPANYLGMECSGTVTQVGENFQKDFSVGDSVCCLTEGCLQTHVRCKFSAAIKIPEGISLQTAAAIPISFSTAYYAIHHVARMKQRESILIHSGAGGLGQACIQLAKLLDADVYATVGSESKKQFLIKTYGISETKIFSSRTPAFAEEIKRLTHGQGVDVVINSLAGEALKCSWECIAAFGRFIEVGKKDIHGFGTLPMFPFSRNATFAGVDLFYVHQHLPRLAQSILQSTVALLVEGKITAPSPVHIFPGSEIEKAFRYLESGTSTGKIVINLEAEDLVMVRNY